MEQVQKFMLMLYMKENLKIIQVKAMVQLFILIMVKFKDMKENGKLVYMMDMVLHIIKMGLFIMENIKMVQEMDSVYIMLITKNIMQVNLKMVFMKDMVKFIILIQKGNLKDHLKKVFQKDSELNIFLMEIQLKDIGKMENQMNLLFFTQLKVKLLLNIMWRIMKYLVQKLINLNK